MKKQRWFYFLNLLTLFLLSLAGCGGNESYISTSSTTATVPFRGVVEDGPIAGAKISLRDKNGTYYPLYNSQGHDEYLVSTDGNGLFSRAVNAGTDFSNLTVRAVGGIDRDTGMDFNGLEMRSPLGLFNGDVSAIVVSPLTTLVAELHDQHGFTFAEAKTRLREWLALPVDVDLAAAPHTNLDLQRCTLLLSKIALDMETSQPFQELSLQASAPGTSLFLEKGSIDPLILTTVGLNDLDVERVSDLQDALNLLNPEVNGPADVFSIFKSEELTNRFDENFREKLEISPSFDGNYRVNIKFLTEKTISAAGGEVFLLIEPIPSRLFRHIFNTYMASDLTSSDPLKRLSPQEKLFLDPLLFASILSSGNIGLDNDPWIALLARSSAANSVDSPLLRNELPGNDNQLRVDYFYGSDISPHFLAERLIGRVFDDEINDAVLLKIIEGKASAGLIDEALTLIATQIVQSEPKANAYRAVANTLIKYQRFDDALKSLDLARDLYRKVIAAKGIASATATDVDNLLATATSYRKAGDQVNAQSILNDVANIARVLSTSTAIVYGKLITGIKNVVDAYIDMGDLEAAAPLVDAMYHYSGSTPLYNNTYQLRVYNWSECAKRFATLGNQAKVLQVFSDISLLRSSHAATATASWPQIPDVVESLYRVGATADALALAATIPAGTTNQSKAYKLVATYEALQGNMETAFSIVDNSSYVPKDEDRVDLLTYFNSSRPYIGEVLINNGRLDEARQALEKAKSILDGMALSDNLARISNGYVRVAELYGQMGSPADVVKAKELLQSAQNSMADDPYVVAAIADTALGYYMLKEPAAALTLLDHAKSLADADPGHYRANVTPRLGTEEYAAQLYEKLVKSYEKIGDKVRVRTSTLSFQTWVKKIHTTGTVNDQLAIKECSYLLRAVLYLDNAGFHDDAMATLQAAREMTVGRVENTVTVYDIVITKDRLANCLKVIATYAAIHEDAQGLNLALSLSFTTERNQALQSLANAIVDRDDFPESAVASIDSDGDGKPNFFHPLATTEDIAASGLILDDDSDGDGIIDTLDIRPLFKD